MVTSSETQVGDRVELVRLDGEERVKLSKGDRGTVYMIDYTGTIYVDWDNGTVIGLLPGVDKWNVVGNAE